MEKKDYSVKFFYKGLPAWKRKKDPIYTRFVMRPLSFIGASICANNGISANTVSYVSGWIAILGCLFFLPKDYWCHITGAILFNVWLFMDCIDGNLARCVKKQPFGIFADAISSYILVGFMSTFMGFAVYFEGGILFDAGCPWIILVGALASSFDTLMRLIYHKYEQAHAELVSKGIMPVENDDHNDHSMVGDWKIRIEQELGIAGILPFMILICAVFKCLDIAILYCFFYYGGSLLISYIMFVRRAITNALKYQDKMPQNNDTML